MVVSSSSSLVRLAENPAPVLTRKVGLSQTLPSRSARYVSISVSLPGASCTLSLRAASSTGSAVASRKPSKPSLPGRFSLFLKLPRLVGSRESWYADDVSIWVSVRGGQPPASRNGRRGSTEYLTRNTPKRASAAGFAPPQPGCCYAHNDGLRFLLKARARNG